MKEIKIEGMMCDNCRRHAEEALKKLDSEARVDLKEKKGFIKEEIDDSKIIEAIEEAGYEVVEIK